jgi:hypothetical protein
VCAGGRSLFRRAKSARPVARFSTVGRPLAALGLPAQPRVHYEKASGKGVALYSSDCAFAKENADAFPTPRESLRRPPGSPGPRPSPRRDSIPRICTPGARAPWRLLGARDTHRARRLQRLGPRRNAGGPPCRPSRASRLSDVGGRGPPPLPRPGLEARLGRPAGRCPPGVAAGRRLNGHGLRGVRPPRRRRASRPRSKAVSSPHRVRTPRAVAWSRPFPPVCAPFHSGLPDSFGGARSLRRSAGGVSLQFILQRASRRGPGRP